MSLTEAKRRDAENPLSEYRERFFIPQETIYLDGNSLGLFSVDAEQALSRAIGQWQTLGIKGWLEADPPWFYLGELLGQYQSPLMGCDPQEVVAASSTTVNLHQLVGTFFSPNGRRTKILADELNFPSDLYALASQLRLRGLDPEEHLILAKSQDGRTLDENELIDAMSDEVALILLPSVLYRSGQLLDMETLTQAAHQRGIIIGFDCSHSAGAMPHQLSDWAVDFAFWCTYKYLNSGPGGLASLYVNQAHFDRLPALAGWWGSNKERQFDMAVEFSPAQSAGAWQISTPPILSAAPLLGSLKMFQEADIFTIRQTSIQMTQFLINGITEHLLPRGMTVGSPRAPHRRGGHVALEHPQAKALFEKLTQRGVVADYRPPNVIRLAPVALYNQFVEIWEVIEILAQLLDSNGISKPDDVRT